MLKLFFGRGSKIVFALEAIGIAGFVWILFSGTANAIFLLYLLCYLFIRFCAMWNWYKKFQVRHDAGISLHFEKMIVIASYIIAITNIVIILGGNAIIYLAVILIVFVAHVNAILLYFHFKDRDPTPPNFFSGV